MTRKIQIFRYQPGNAPRQEVAALLAEAVGNPTGKKLDELIGTCNKADFPALWIASCSDSVVGILRLESEGRSRCVVTHIAVHQSSRGQGIGRKLVEFLRDDLNFRQAEAETDDDALGFYKSCGFMHESVGEQIQGTQRYKCVIRWN